MQFCFNAYISVLHLLKGFLSLFSDLKDRKNAHCKSIIIIYIYISASACISRKILVSVTNARGREFLKVLLTGIL